MAHNGVAGRSSWATYAAWIAVGLGLSLGIVSVYSFGTIDLAVTIAFAALLALSKGTGAAASGLMAGLAVPIFYIAFANRQGPGTVCTANSLSESCSYKWNPWPWFIVGMLLVGLSVWLFEHPGRQRPAAMQKLLHHGRA
jgi:hypothetical protein